MLIKPRRKRKRHRPTWEAPAAPPPPTPKNVWVNGVMDNGDGSYTWNFDVEGGGLVIALAEGVATVPQLKLSGEFGDVAPTSVIAAGNNELIGIYDAPGHGEWMLQSAPEGLVLNVEPAWQVPASGQVEIP